MLAHTPQAKGRVEWAWGTLQDRLVSELRLVNASTIEQANEVLCDFLPRYNSQFRVPAAQPGSAYRQPSPGLCLDGVLCFKYIRTVANDNTVRFNGSTIQLLPDDHRAIYARADVEVQERLDGIIVVAYRDRILAAEPAALEPVTLRARGGPARQRPFARTTYGSRRLQRRTHTPAGAERRNGEAAGGCLVSVPTASHLLRSIGLHNELWALRAILPRRLPVGLYEQTGQPLIEESSIRPEPPCWHKGLYRRSLISVLILRAVTSPAAA